MIGVQGMIGHQSSGMYCRFAMRQLAAFVVKGLGVCLLLMAVAISDLNCCQLNSLSGPREENRENDCSCAEQFARESSMLEPRAHRADRRGAAVRGDLPRLHRRHLGANSWLGQICLSDGFRGVQLFQHGCGAVLLR